MKNMLFIGLLLFSLNGFADVLIESSSPHYSIYAVSANQPNYDEVIQKNTAISSAAMVQARKDLEKKCSGKLHIMSTRDSTLSNKDGVLDQQFSIGGYCAID